MKTFFKMGCVAFVLIAVLFAGPAAAQQAFAHQETSLDQFQGDTEIQPAGSKWNNVFDDDGYTPPLYYPSEEARNLKMVPAYDFPWSTVGGGSYIPPLYYALHKSKDARLASRND